MIIDARLFATARVLTGETRLALSERLGVSPRTIVNWETGGVPQHRNILVLSKYGDQITEAQRAIAGSETPGPLQPPAEEDGNAADPLAAYSTVELLDEVKRRLTLAGSTAD